MWSNVVQFVQSIFTGTFSLFSQLNSNEIISHGFKWLICGFVVLCVYRYIIIPLTGSGVRSFMGIVSSASDDNLRRDKK